MTPARTTCIWVTAYCPVALVGCQRDGGLPGQRVTPHFGVAACGVGSFLQSGYGLDVLEEQITSNGQRKRDPVWVQKGDRSAL